MVFLFYKKVTDITPRPRHQR